MGKYFVTILKQRQLYKVCRDDINKVFSHRIKKIPKVPTFDPQQFKEDDTVTQDQETGIDIRVNHIASISRFKIILTFFV